MTPDIGQCTLDQYAADERDHRSLDTLHVAASSVCLAGMEALTGDQIKRLQARISGGEQLRLSSHLANHPEVLMELAHPATCGAVPIAGIPAAAQVAREYLDCVAAVVGRGLRRFKGSNSATVAAAIVSGRWLPRFTYVPAAGTARLELVPTESERSAVLVFELHEAGGGLH